MPNAITADKKEQKKIERAKLAELRMAVKDFCKTMDGIAKDLAKLDGESLDSWMAQLEKLGFNMSKDFDNHAVTVSFDQFSCRKFKPKNAKPQPEDKADGLDLDPEIELVPAGDLLGSDGEIPNFDVDEDEIDDFDDHEHDDDDDDTFGDYRDEADEDLVASRREYFGMASEYGEDVDE